MSTLNVTGHLPTINSTGVFLNETLRIYFDKAIEPQSVTWETVSVHDNATYVTQAGGLGVVWSSGVDGVAYVKEVTWVPEVNLVANNQYSVYIHGNPDGILGANGEVIEDTYMWQFTTGTGVYTEDGGSGVPSGWTPPTGAYPDISGMPSGVEAAITSFTVYSTNPQNQEPNIDTNLSGIEIVFTGDVETPLDVLSGYITITETPVLY